MTLSHSTFNSYTILTGFTSKIQSISIFFSLISPLILLSQAITVSLDIFESHRDPKGLPVSSSAFASMPQRQWRRHHTQVVPLLTRLAAPHLDLNLIYFASLLACRIIQTNQSHPQDVNGGRHTSLLVLQSLLPTALLIHSVPKSNSYAALCGVCSTRLCLTHKLLSISSVQG